MQAEVDELKTATPTITPEGVAGAVVDEPPQAALQLDREVGQAFPLLLHVHIV